jgi:glycine C-acetyltransferase/8-amino-7-oxononanoate synthase
MNWEDFLKTRLEADRQEHLSRECKIIPADMLNFGGNDYMGFSRHPDLVEAAMSTLKSTGMGSRASRLLSGHSAIHTELEEALATLKQTEAALTFPNGYTTAVGVIPALIDRSSTVILDEKSHACLWDGARLSGAKIRMMRHNDMDHLEEILTLERSRGTNSSSHSILIIAESLYSMEGDRAPLEKLIELKQKWGAWLLVDEAHATGVFGSGGQGLIHSSDMSEQIEIQLGTLGKAIGSLGGFAAGSADLIRMLLQHARSFIFSTATPPALAAAALAGVRLIQSNEGAKGRKRLAQLVGHTANNPIHPIDVHSQIIPIPIGDEEKALQIAGGLWAKKYYVPAIRYPTVARGAARLRLSLTAQHTTGEIDEVLKLLNTLSSPEQS